jgi:hypothetical protein
VIIDEHGMLPGLLSNFLQGLLDVLCSGCHPIQFTLVSLVELVAILLHGSLLGVEGLKLAKEGGNGQQITQKLQTRHMIFFFVLVISQQQPLKRPFKIASKKFCWLFLKNT